VDGSHPKFLQELNAMTPDLRELTTLHNHGKPSSVKKEKKETFKLTYRKADNGNRTESLLRLFSSKSGQHPRTADGCISGLKMIT